MISASGGAPRFTGKRVIVTGAGSLGEGLGNGKAAAILYAREGARLVLVDRDADRVEETAGIVRREGGECTTVVTDVSTPEGVEGYVSHALKALGGIDVLHCNVGIAADETTTEMSLKRWRLVYRVNVDSLLLACQAVLPHMRAAGGGAIVNISSIASIRSTGRPFPAYASSKAAANALIREVAIEGAPHGIRANTVVIGYVDTPTVAAAYADRADEWDDFVARRSRAVPRGRQGTAMDTARAALFLASDDADFITGMEIVVDGGMTRISGQPLAVLLRCFRHAYTSASREKARTVFPRDVQQFVGRPPPQALRLLPPARDRRSPALSRYPCIRYLSRRSTYLSMQRLTLNAASA